MVKDLYASFAINYIERIYEIGNLFLVRLSKCCEDDDFPMFEFALDGRDYSDNMLDIYYTDGTWKMTAHCGIGFDFELLTFGITPLIHFLNHHGREIDFNEIRKTFGIEEEDK